MRKPFGHRHGLETKAALHFAHPISRHAELIVILSRYSQNMLTRP